MVNTNSLNAPVTNNTLLRGNGTGFSVISSANNSTLVTSGTGVPSLSTTLPTAVQDNITTLGLNVQIAKANAGATSQIALTNTSTTNFSNARMVVQTSTSSSIQSYAYFWSINNFGGFSFGCNSTQDNYYMWRGSPLAGNVVASWDVNNLFSNAGAISCGTGGVIGGTIQLNGATSQSVTLNPSANAGDWFFNFPDNPGTAGQALLSDGGSGGMTWGAPPISLTGDTGTPFSSSSVTIYSNQATNNSGSSIAFDATSPNMTLNVTDVSGNTFLGKTSGNLTHTGAFNSGFGRESLQNLTTGADNTGVGVQSLGSTTTGLSNCSLGRAALGGVVTGSFNIGIGAYAGDSFTGAESSCILLNSYGNTAVSNQLIIGQATGTGNQELNSAYIHGIYSNTQNPSGTVEYVTINNTTGLLGVTTVSGLVTFTGDTGTPFSSSSVTIRANSQAGASVLFNASTPNITLNVTDSNANTFIGLGTGAGGGAHTYNVGLGRSSIAAITSGDYNIAIGANAMNGADGLSRSIAIGRFVLQSNINGDTDNIGIGDSALSALNGVDNIIAIGSNCLASSVSDSGSCCVGYNSCAALNGGNNNTCFGTQTMQSSVTSASNTIVGFESLFSATASSSNCTLGYASLYGLLTGGFNVSLGYNAGTNYIGSESSNILLNSLGVAAESNVLRIGKATGTGSQELSTAFIHGIVGNTVSNANMVTIDTTTGQLGVQTIPLTTLPWTDEATTFSAVSKNGYFTTATVTANLPASPTQGDIISFIVDAANVLTIQANTGQTIRIGSSVSTTAGTAASAAQGDSVTLIYRSSDTSWIASSVIGTWTTA